MTEAIKSLGYRIWVQNKISRNTVARFQIYDELTNPDNNAGWMKIGHPLSYIRTALYDSIIVHLDMIKTNRGVSLLKLIQEAHDDNFVNKNLCDDFKNQIDIYNGVLKRIKKQRNYIVVHRSKSHTFAEVQNKYPVSKSDLRDVTSMYYRVAGSLRECVPFHEIGDLVDQRSFMRSTNTALLRYFEET